MLLLVKPSKNSEDSKIIGYFLCWVTPISPPTQINESVRKWCSPFADINRFEYATNLMAPSDTPRLVKKNDLPMLFVPLLTKPLWDLKTARMAQHKICQETILRTGHIFDARATAINSTWLSSEHN